MSFSRIDDLFQKNNSIKVINFIIDENNKKADKKLLTSILHSQWIDD